MTVKTVYTGQKHYDVDGVGYEPEGDIKDQDGNKAEPQSIEDFKACINCRKL